MRREPLLKKGLVLSAVAASLTLIVAFGVPLSAEQRVAIIGFVGAWLPIIAALIGRSDVTPVNDPRDNEGNELVQKGMQ